MGNWATFHGFVYLKLFSVDAFKNSLLRCLHKIFKVFLYLQQFLSKQKSRQLSASIEIYYHNINTLSLLIFRRVSFFLPFFTFGIMLLLFLTKLVFSLILFGYNFSTMSVYKEASDRKFLAVTSNDIKECS